MDLAEFALQFFCDFANPPFITQEIKEAPANQSIDPKQLAVTDDWSTRIKQPDFLCVLAVRVLAVCALAGIFVDVLVGGCVSGTRSPGQ